MSKPTLSDPHSRATSDSTGSEPQGGFADLVPELGVSDIQGSLSFWRDLIDFEIAYDLIRFVERLGARAPSSP